MTGSRTLRFLSIPTAPTAERKYRLGPPVGDALGASDVAVVLVKADYAISADCDPSYSYRGKYVRKPL